MILYCNQLPVNFILHFAELHIGSSIRYENTKMFGNYFLNCYVVKRILISFNCFSEYCSKLCQNMISVYFDSVLCDGNYILRFLTFSIMVEGHPRNICAKSILKWDSSDDSGLKPWTIIVIERISPNRG